MAYSPKSVLPFLLIFGILLAIAVNAVEAGREIPTNSGNADMKQPEFFHKDGSFLVPGIGRFMFPRDHHGHNPLTYNPVTGTSGPGILGQVPSYGTIGSGTGRGYIPGGDDTLVPNPGVEVPIPGGGGSTPAVPAARP